MSDSLRRQLLFEVGGHLFAADVGEVWGVRTLSEATPVPGSAPGVLGLINLQGSIVVAGDLAIVLGLDSPPGESSVFVLLQRDERRVALRVDRVLAVALGADAQTDVDLDPRAVLGAPEAVADVSQFESRPLLRLSTEVVLGLLLGPAADRQRPDRAVARGGR